MVIATSNDYVAAPLEIVAPQAALSSLRVAGVLLINKLVEVVTMVPWGEEPSENLKKPNPPQTSLYILTHCS